MDVHRAAWVVHPLGHESLAKDFIQDINDGYFPSQLQSDYPDGVPLQVDDRRNKLYLISNKNNHFSSKTNKSAFQDFQNDIQAESSKTNHYLNKFPPLFIRNGDINYIRSGAKSFVQDEEILFKVIQDDNYCESSGICLKIRFTTGCQTYMLHVNVRDTIESVMTIIREELLKVKRKINDFELFSTHPTRVYSELEQTLVSCGINHNMLLYARYRPETKKTIFY
ncbi:hypothetical protein HELRODRAFT_160418 [Helobdella robusta]|uniref:SEP domain-containing protein n=1 Tax=Helobdella robusta TaxID=6412 RepID=T1EQ81_HELRO|nr:hypothetical protein HELRODRAFT_160418 [Helobdella robusta]ESO06258.1 hypothetical protein HELRODRAFT_160418 [Helobdella robusta]